MPFKKWEVEPVYLSRKPLPAGVSVSDELEVTANSTLVGSLRQLSCLLQLARHVFEGITAECQLVYQRAEVLQNKVKHCEGLTESLDAKSVAVPVSSLEQYSQIHQHYGTQYEQSTQQFQESSRPDCVDTLYNKASATPVPLIRTIDRYRTDGRTGSKLFMVTPVLGDEEKKKKNEHLDIETRRPASFALARDWQEDEEFSLPDVTRLAWLVSPSSERMSRGNADKSLVRLPSPEERMHALSLDYPSTVVPVDVTGSSLHRLFGLRRSLIHADFIIKRKKKKKAKRRNTIAEGSSKELQEAVKISRELVHTSCQTDDLGPQVGKPLQSRRSFFFRKKDGTLAKEPQLWKESGHAAVSSAGGPKVADKKAESADTNRRTDKSSTKSRVRSFIPISTLSSAMTVAVKLRQSSSRAGGKPGDDGRSSSGNWSGSSSTRASVDSDHQQASVSPDGACSPSRSSLGKDSVLSDYTHQDIDGRSQDDTLTGYNSETSTSAAAPPSHSQASAAKPAQEQQAEDSWLQTTDQGTQSSTSTPENYPSDTTSTPQVLSPFLTRRDPGGAASPQPSPGPMDDGDSSVYSVDTDGYYTSMHTDSGLWNRSSHRHMDLGHDMGRGKVRRGSQSSVSTIGNGSLNSFLSRTVTEGSSINGSLTKKKVPPQPPPRVSSIIKLPSEKDKEKEDNRMQDMDGKKTSSDSSESPLLLNGEVSTSDSDHEAGERIKEKTTINPSRYPSMCAVSPETSDDDDRLGKCEQPGSARVAVVTVAEVHQVEAPEDSKIIPNSSRHNSPSSQLEVQKSLMSPKGGNHETKLPVSQPLENKSPQKESPSRLNMYCDQHIQKSSFSSVLSRNNSKSPSPEKHLLASFSPAHHPTSPTAFNDKGAQTFNTRQNTTSGQFQGNGSRLIISSPPVDSQHLSPQEEKSLIPLKYAQHITVTPKARELSPTSPSSPTSKVPRSPSSPLNHPLNSPGYSASMHSESSQATFRFPPLFQNGHGVQSHIPTVASNTHPPGPVSDARATSPPVVQTSPVRTPWVQAKSSLPHSTSLTVTSSEKPMARVTLDPSGKVIYASNSLGRRRTGHPSRSQPTSPSQDQKFATLPLRQSLVSQLPTSVSIDKVASPTVRNSRCSPLEQRKESCTAGPQSRVYPQSKDSAFRIIRYDSSPTRYGNDSPCKVPTSKSSSAIYSSPQKKEGIPPSTRSTVSSPTDHQRSLTSPVSSHSQSIPSSISSQSLSAWKNDMRRAFFDTPLSSTPRTSPQTICYSPSRTSNLQTPAFSNSPSPVASQSISSPTKSVVQSPPQQAVPNEKTVPSSIDLSQEDIKRKPLSAAELFAIIHKSKKRHNIKTDQETSSSPLSSRSSSPSVGRPSTPSKGALAETGFLTPRSTNTNTPKNRHSWVGEGVALSNGTTPERKSLVQDRLGPSRPTSMHDFKMLLLQTRSTTNSDRSQKSAAELLKTSAPKKVAAVSEEPMSQSLPTSPVKSMSGGVIMPPSPSWSGHSTVPMKRGTRIRSSLQPRYDLAYPPIWEDCSEEGEIHREQQNCHPDTRTSSDSVKGNQNYSRIFRQGAVAHSQENKVPVSQYNGTQTAPVTSTWV